MFESIKRQTAWKQKVVRELADYWTTFAFLALFLAAFTAYRRLVLAEYHISYFHFGFAMVEAIILAKIVLLGETMHLGRWVERRPLILPTLYKALVFSVWVGVFKLIEHTLAGLLDGKGLWSGWDAIKRQGADAFLAETLLVFSAFIPFFAFKEMGRVLGEGTIGALFFRKGQAEGLKK